MLQSSDQTSARGDNPPGRKELQRRARQLVQTGRYSEAIDAYGQIVRADPSDAHARLKIGDLRRKLGQIAEAVSSYEDVGEQYRAAGQLLKAVAVYKHILDIVRLHADELGGRHGHVAIDLAETYATLGLFGEALATYDEVATYERSCGRVRQAIVLYQRMRTLDPVNPVIEVRLAECMVELSELNSALALLAHAADRFREHGKLEEALAVLDRLLELRPDPKFYRLAAELHLFRGGERDALEALRKLRHCFDLEPEDLATLELIARAFDAVGKRDEATAVLVEAARIVANRNDASAYSTLLHTLMVRSPNSQAVQQIEQLRRTTSGARRLAGPDIDGDISEVLFRRGRLTRRVLDEDALWRADELADAGRHDEARMILEQVSRTMPDHQLVREAIARNEALEQQAWENSVDTLPLSCPILSGRRPQLESVTQA